ncbi:MAG: ATP-binding protein [Bacteroidales bacterium]|nr:ATP-binding protein [Bacteroidales bacterium]MBO7462876.1 ATP-binding protein [Bacteroidales bacterium]
MSVYKHRIVDDILLRKLQGKGAVLIEGPKWCGKTTTASQIAKSSLKLGEVNTLRENRALADIDPVLLLKGSVPRLIDEWQTIPVIWDAVRSEVDNRNMPGQFILTGSAVPIQTDEIIHTGTGRISRLSMRTMSLVESGDSTGEIRLSSLFEIKDNIFAQCDIDIEQLAYLVCRGGWPQAVLLRHDIALDQAIDYYDAVVNHDISRMDNVGRDPDRVKLLMRSYSRHQGASVSYGAICNDMKSNDNSKLSDETVAAYIKALKRIFVIEDLPAWNPNLRSKSAIRTADTRYFSDPSVATAALGIGPGDLINDLETFGLVFETLCVRDLRIFAEAIGGSVYHYRDSNGLECDAVIHLRNGHYGLVEIKLGGDRLIEEGAKNLLKLANIIDTTRMPEPSFMMVLIGIGKYAYRRKDGVYVVPIGCLGR